jgi:hypothetical protein
MANPICMIESNGNIIVSKILAFCLSRFDVSFLFGGQIDVAIIRCVADRFVVIL